MEPAWLDGGGQTPHCVLFILGGFPDLCPDTQGADLGAGVQWAAGASLWNPNPQPFPGREAGHREGVSFPTSPGWPPQDLGHQCSSPMLCLLQANVPVGFFKCMNVWENLHVGTTSYLHLWLFMKSQNCSEDREPQRCQDTLGEVMSSPLDTPSASFGRTPGVRQLFHTEPQDTQGPCRSGPGLGCSLHLLPEPFRGLCR